MQEEITLDETSIYWDKLCKEFVLVLPDKSQAIAIRAAPTQCDSESVFRLAVIWVCRHVDRDHIIAVNTETARYMLPIFEHVMRTPRGKILGVFTLSN